APAAVRTQPASAPRAAPLPPAPPPAWPAGVPGRAEAAAALGEALAGDAGSAGSIAARVAEGLSDLERSVLAGELQPFDDAPISDAAAMRVRVAAALATAPRPGDPIDAAAVTALLADFDALLSRVNAVAEDAPDGARAFIEPIRDDLVRLAIRFSQRASPAEPDPAPTAPTAAAPAPPARARLLSIGQKTHHPRRLAPWIALGAVVFLGGAYHAWTAHEKAAARAVDTSGLPAGLTEIPGPPGGPRVLVRASTTVAPDPAELSRFRAAEESKGNRVRESDGVIFVEPAPPAALPQPEAR
ncbi:MAG TPA: hypothetical protein VFK90_16210, partial [Anaeromyxobacter sp.]|nr:hypothetical protein [Anaeromyxobacter sp.]